MTRWAVFALSAAFACSSGPKAAPTPAPRAPAGEAGGSTASSSGRILYQIKAPLSYEIRRYDSITFQNINSALPQVTGRRAHVSVRPDGSRLQIAMDSVVVVLGQKVSPSVLDSAREATFELKISPTGPSGDLKTQPETALVGQIAAGVRLLFPQLPDNGARAGDVWSDSTSYDIRLDAFDARETAARQSKAARGGSGALRVEGVERLTRRGSAKRDGREMGLTGSGLRQVTYDLVPEGWVSFLIARDSLDLVVTVPDSPAPIPVRWRSTIIARLRGSPPR